MIDNHLYCHLTHEKLSVKLVFFGGPRDTENILVYTGKILPVTTLLKSAFLVSIYYVIKQHCCSSQLDTLCMCTLDARFFHSFSQDGGSPTFIQVYRWCLHSLSVRNNWWYINVNYYKLFFNSVLELISV